MPGRTDMDTQRAIGSQDLKRDRSQAQEETPGSQPPAHASASGEHTSNGPLTNGVPGNDELPPTTNGEATTMNPATTGMEAPPPLDQSWREHDSNKRLGLLMERLAQKCYKDLNSTLTQMSQISVQPPQNQPNGIVPHTGEDTSNGSLQKKRLLMNFAKEQRDRFIKTLVLSDWCKNEEDLAKLIDIKVWEDKQREAQASATRAIEQTKLNMIPAKVPNPNIEGAMELLATGKASWIPDLGYLPPKRLTAKQLLKTLRNMNVALATRLNLHEDLPPHFQDFSIADGRATFTVQDEFEVDLSVADEDPATPFYFIDIRLAFTPASNIFDERLRGFMEAKVNQELSVKGLKGCYDFLHNFVITHKINVLRSQAAEMIRTKWFDCIRTENMRRNFIVQYWAGLPGPKSWIEIGISSGKERSALTRKPATPQLSVRWFRRGVEVKEAIEFDWRNLSLEKSVSKVIAKHTEWLLEGLKTRIRSLAEASSFTDIEIVNLDSETETPTLMLNQATLREPLQVRIEPITGQFSITPATKSTAHVEGRLNSDPSANAAKWLAWLVCVAAQERVRKASELLGWMPTANIVKQDNLQRVFGEAVRHISVYSPSKLWGDRWALAVTFSLGSSKWWVVSLEKKGDEQGDVNGKVIGSARHLPLADLNAEGRVSRSLLLRIEKLAVAQVAFSTLTKKLEEMHVPCSTGPVTSSDSGEEATEGGTSPKAMFIRFAPLVKPPHDKAWKPWAAELIRVAHDGLMDESDATDDDVGTVKHELRLALEPQNLKSLQKYLGQAHDRNMLINTSGGLALRFLTPFGQPFAEQIQKRLRSVERLDLFVAALQKKDFKCTQVSLSRLAFTYNETPELSAQLNFSNDGDLPIRLKLLPSDSNPHQRIRVLLEKGLNDATDNTGFASFAGVFRFNLPVLQTLDELERTNLAKRTLVIYLRTTTNYLLRYRSPLPACEFRLQAKRKVEGERRRIKWCLEKTRTTTVKSEDKDDSARYAGLPEDLTRELKELWKSKAAHWEGMGHGVVADSPGMREALLKLDEIVRRFEVAEEVPAKVKEETKTAQPPSQAQTASTTPANTAPVKSEPDVIMLD